MRPVQEGENESVYPSDYVLFRVNPPGTHYLTFRPSVGDDPVLYFELCPVPPSDESPYELISLSQSPSPLPFWRGSTPPLVTAQLVSVEVLYVSSGAVQKQNNP